MTSNDPSRAAEHALAEVARLKEQAKMAPAGKDRALLLRKARQAETASHINEWVNSQGLKAPK
jgi:hypothetical protein